MASIRRQAGIRSGSKLESRLPDVMAELRPKVSAAVKKGAQHVSDEAERTVPIGPPDVHLRDHFHVKRLGPAEYEVAAGDGETWYAHMVEFGTSHSAPRPFLIPALEANREYAVYVVRQALISL